ncbi:MAG: DUF4278 domain-containing protein [Leptolyngbya sp. SIO4C1]|nr:DUF4278 domain-containing protein [Leptolyngbya sp. SIO4C1]
MMNLSYRGVKYVAASSAVDVVESEALGQYRGASYHIKQPATLPQRARSQGLVYRGAIVR